jgi:hypothetical protein
MALSISQYYSNLIACKYISATQENQIFDCTGPKVRVDTSSQFDFQEMVDVATWSYE